MTRLTPQGNANSFGGTNFRYNNITIDGAASDVPGAVVFCAMPSD